MGKAFSLFLCRHLAKGLFFLFYINEVFSLPTFPPTHVLNVSKETKKAPVRCCESSGSRGLGSRPRSLGWATAWLAGVILGVSWLGSWERAVAGTCSLSFFTPCHLVLLSFPPPMETLGLAEQRAPVSRVTFPSLCTSFTIIPHTVMPCSCFWDCVCCPSIS